MVGESNISDLSGGKFLANPCLYAKSFQFLPGGSIGQHMHEIIINVISLQPSELFAKCLFYAFHGLYHIMRKLCCEIYFVTALQAVQDLPHSCFIARVDIGGIQIIYPAFYSCFYLRLCFVQVYSDSLSGKAHTSIAEN